MEQFPLTLKERQMWTTSKKNHGSLRPLTPQKAEAVKEPDDKLVELEVLTESQAGHYSHAHLAPKIPSGWRCTCDFRELNDNCGSMRWLIPTIPGIVARSGAKRPNVFAKIDGGMMSSRMRWKHRHPSHRQSISTP